MGGLDKKTGLGTTKKYDSVTGLPVSYVRGKGLKRRNVPTQLAPNPCGLGSGGSRPRPTVSNENVVRANPSGKYGSGRVTSGQIRNGSSEGNHFSSTRAPISSNPGEILSRLGGRPSGGSAPQATIVNGVLASPRDSLRSAGHTRDAMPQRFDNPIRFAGEEKVEKKAVASKPSKVNRGDKQPKPVREAKTPVQSKPKAVIKSYPNTGSSRKVAMENPFIQGIDRSPSSFGSQTESWLNSSTQTGTKKVAPAMRVFNHRIALTTSEKNFLNPKVANRTLKKIDPISAEAKKNLKMLLAGCVFFSAPITVLSNPSYFHDFFSKPVRGTNNAATQASLYAGYLVMLDAENQKKGIPSCDELVNGAYQPGFDSTIGTCRNLMAKAGVPIGVGDSYRDFDSGEASVSVASTNLDKGFNVASNNDRTNDTGSSPDSNNIIVAQADINTASIAFGDNFNTGDSTTFSNFGDVQDGPVKLQMSKRIA